MFGAKHDDALELMNSESSIYCRNDMRFNSFVPYILLYNFSKQILKYFDVNLDLSGCQSSCDFILSLNPFRKQVKEIIIKYQDPVNGHMTIQGDRREFGIFIYLGKETHARYPQCI